MMPNRWGFNDHAEHHGEHVSVLHTLPLDKEQAGVRVWPSAKVRTRVAACPDMLGDSGTNQELPAKHLTREIRDASASIWPLRTERT